MRKFYKLCKLLLCGVYNLLRDKELPSYFLIFVNHNFLNNGFLDKNKKYVDLSKTKFLEMFPKIKFIKYLKENRLNFNENCILKNENLTKNKFSFLTQQKVTFGKNGNYRFSDYAGMKNFLQYIQELIILPIINFRLYKEENLELSRGIILNGPPGCGKTFLVDVIGGELNLPIFYLFPHKLSNPLSGINEKKIQKLFEMASKNSPSILFIDDIDILALKRDNGSREHEKKLFSQLLFSLDELKKNKRVCVIVLGATNFLDQLDDSIRRPGRFDKEINFKIPSVSTRLEIIKSLGTKFSFSFDTESLALETKGYVSGDLFNLISIAASFTVSRLSKTLIASCYREKIQKKNHMFIISHQDLIKAKKMFNPGLKKNGFSNSHDIFWSNIGALDQIKKVLSKYIIEPIRFPDRKMLNYSSGIGILLYGPPGCGKTLLINAAVKESGANFIFIKGPELLNKFLGESEKGIRLIFSRAKMLDPTIIFFDEFDSVASKREHSHEITNSASNDRIVNQLLTEIDSIEKDKSIYFIGATNRPNSIDKALLRPGRIDKVLAVPYPNLEGKILILKTIFKKGNYLPYLNLNLFVDSLKNNFTGADLNLAYKEASIDSIRTSVEYFLFKSSKKGIFIDRSMIIGTKNLHYGIYKIILNRKTKGHYV